MSNSLREEANNLELKLNEIRLSIRHLSNRNKVFILLEGKTDIKLFKKLFNNTYTDITSLDGKDKVISAIKKLNEESYKSIIGIRDADFEHLKQNNSNINNLFLTDFHDMEIHMIESKALDSLFIEHSTNNCDNIIEQLKNNIYEIAVYIGYSRLFNENQKESIGNHILLFDGLAFKNFIEKEECKLKFDSNAFIRELLEHSKKKNQNLSLSKEELYLEIENLKNIHSDKLQICSGHDLAKLIGIILFNSPDGNKIEEGLRLSYRFEDFKTTILYSSLIEWTTNNGFRLF